MTHAELVARAARWLKNTVACGVVLAERHAWGESPDAIGWKLGVSFLVECKATRADFFADSKKQWQRYPKKGMGNRRYFMVPAKMVRLDEVPALWGLPWVYPAQVRVQRAIWKLQTANLKAERDLLYLSLRREFLKTIVERTMDEENQSGWTP